MSENTSKTSENIAAETLVTGFQAAAILNALFEEAGINRELRSQQVYNYMKNGTVPTVETDEVDTRTGNRRRKIRLADLKDLYERLANNQVAVRRSRDELLAEFKNL